MRIFTVLRQGGQYSWDHAERLGEQVEKFSGYPLDVFSDDDMNHNLPGWWSKMELFDESGPILYMDLDTTIVGDITPLIEEVQKHDFLILRDFNHRRNMGSGLMGWSGDMSEIYREFMKDPAASMQNYRGDQEYIQDNYFGNVTYWQDVLPNMVQSYKLHVRRNKMHPDCRVVCFHGKPKPWDISEITKE